jgi:hypothetical protein
MVKNDLQRDEVFCIFMDLAVYIPDEEQKE